MIDGTQALLTVVIIVLTIILSVIFVQVYFILKEFRATLSKANKVLDDTGIISESVSRPVSMLSSMLIGLKGGSTIMKFLSSIKKSREE